MDLQPRHAAESVRRPAVYWLMGLPFDCVDREEAIARVRSAASQRERLLLATPNLNFVRTAHSDAAFHRSLMRSGLSVVDGMSLLWVGRLLGVPFPERVAGSCLAEQMVGAGHRDRLRTFFFGGPDGAADAAAEAVNRAEGGMVSVGALSPGFGSLEDLSTLDVLRKINRARPDFVVVALGAAKGHAWIDHNWDRLDAPVVSHLGAVVNFLAGTVKRAPRWMQLGGLEWFWRILQEPALARRYASDAVFLGRQFVSHVLPLAWHQVTRRMRGVQALKVDGDEDTGTVALRGPLTAATVPTLFESIETRCGDRVSLSVDLSGLTDLDCRGAGALFELGFRWPQCRIELTGAGQSLSRLLRRHRAEVLLTYTQMPTDAALAESAEVDAEVDGALRAAGMGRPT